MGFSRSGPRVRDRFALGRYCNMPFKQSQMLRYHVAFRIDEDSALSHRRAHSALRKRDTFQSECTLSFATHLSQQSNNQRTGDLVLALAGHSLSDQIRIAENADIPLSPETVRWLRKPSQKKCVNCNKPYTPSNNGQKYCEKCRIEREEKALPLYKRNKAKISARLKSAHRERERLLIKLKNMESTIKNLESQKSSIHLWQFQPHARTKLRGVPRAPRLKLARQGKRLVKLRGEAKQLARRLAAMHSEMFQIP